MKKQKIKKYFIFLLSVLLMKKLYAQTIVELTNIALENNTEIISAYKTYESMMLSSKTMDGAFSPQVSFSSSTKFPGEFSWNTSPDYLSSSVSYIQPLPGGTTISISGETSIKKECINNEYYLSQNPNVSISLQQSLLPFWGQGKLKDPIIENKDLQKQYYYNQLLNTKKNILINLAQNFIYSLIYQKQIQISQNSLILINEQIEAVKQLKSTGASSQSKITELLNNKWSSQQDLVNIKANFESSIQSLKTLCNCNLNNISINQLDNIIISTDDFINLIQEATGNSLDFVEENYQLKLKMLSINRCLEKQNSAPIVSISIQPSWNLELQKENEWLDAWKNLNSPSNWSATVGINLSPLISATVKQDKKQYKFNYDSLVNSFIAYEKQKEFILHQYQNLYEQYQKQLVEITNLYNESLIELTDMEKQYTTGAISKIDYDSIKFRVENCNLNMEINELYVWLYDFLIKIN